MLQLKDDTAGLAAIPIKSSDRTTMTALSEESQGYKWLKLLLRGSAIVLGIAETWATRHSMGADGVSYLDMGDAYLRGDWHMAISPHWSPLYSWLLAMALKISKPSDYWEFPVVHLVNFTLYLVALTSFEFLLSALLNYHKRANQDSENTLTVLPEWAWYAIGYTLFLWSSFRLIGLGTVTSDMCVAAFAYLASGLVLRIRAGSTSLLPFLLLGVVLGFGYLAKAIFFPLAFIFLAISFFSVGDLRTASRRVLLAAAIFGAVAAPFMVVLSLFLGRPTFGESGSYNYIQFVDPATFWLPSNAFIHPVKKIYDRPIVIEFARPDKSTFPLWYDPEYWWEGYRAHLNPKGQVRALKAGAIAYYDFLFLSELGLVAGVIVLFWVAPGPWFCLKEVCKNWHLLVPAAAPIGAYSLIHVDSRYIGPFVVLLWLGILSGVRLYNDKEASKLVAGVVLAIIITLGGPVLSSTTFHLAAQRHTAPVDWEVAQALNQMGIQPGDTVGWFPGPVWPDFYWARLARIRVVAEIPPEELDKFWGGSPAVQAGVMNAFERAGVKAVIASPLPPCGATAAWHKLGNTDFYAYRPSSGFGLNLHN